MYRYILHTHIYIYMCVCVCVCAFMLKLQKNLKSIVNLQEDLNTSGVN